MISFGRLLGKFGLLFMISSDHIWCHAIVILFDYDDFELIIACLLWRPGFDGFTLSSSSTCRKVPNLGWAQFPVEAISINLNKTMGWDFGGLKLDEICFLSGI